MWCLNDFVYPCSHTVISQRSCSEDRNNFIIIAKPQWTTGQLLNKCKASQHWTMIGQLIQMKWNLKYWTLIWLKINIKQNQILCVY